MYPRHDPTKAILFYVVAFLSAFPLSAFAPVLSSHPKRSHLEMASIEDQAKQVVRDYATAFNAGDLSKLKDLLAEDAEIQGVLGRGTFDRIAPIWKQLIEGYGMQLEIQELIAEGGSVAARYIERGTFKAPAFGFEPTGKSYELVAMEFFEIENGKIKRRWGARDAASQARQLGLPSDVKA
jgi:steroid delta-isomerase-like uncharacterized protein